MKPPGTTLKNVHTEREGVGGCNFKKPETVQSLLERSLKTGSFGGLVGACSSNPGTGTHHLHICWQRKMPTDKTEGPVTRTDVQHLARTQHPAPTILPPTAAATA